MTHVLRGRRLVAVACLLTFVGAGCTPSDATPPPPPPPSSATPTETTQEREERLAYEAAEKSYREFRAEYYRVLRAGGSNSATPISRATAGGPYLKEAVEVFQAYKGLKSKSIGSLRIVFIRGNGYSPEDVALSVCEDSTDLRSFDKNGRLTGKGELRAIQVSVHKVGERWKVWSGTGRKVSSCDS